MEAPARRTTLAVQPDNLSAAAPNTFKLFIEHLPNVLYWLNQVSLPGVSLMPVQIFRPDNIDAWVPGNNLTYDDFRVSFRIDEDYRNLEELYNWIWSNTKSNKAVLSDGDLHILSNNKNPLRVVKFYNMFPLMFTEVPLSSMDSPDDPLQVDVTFKYTHYQFMPVKDVTST